MDNPIFRKKSLDPIFSRPENPRAFCLLPGALEEPVSEVIT